MVRHESNEMEPSSEFIAATSFETLPMKSNDAPKSGAPLLFFFGFLFTAGGAALAFGPEFSWKVQQVGEKLAAFGFLPGTITVAGLAIFFMGFVARATARSAAFRPAPEESAGDSDFMLVADQLATDLAQVLTSLLQMSEELAALGEGQRTLMAAQTEGAPGDQQQNAIFRLASSVDKLNARVDERFGEFDTQFRSRLDSLSGLVQEAAEAARSQPAPAPVIAPPVAAAPAPAAPVAPAEPAAQAPQPSLGSDLSIDLAQHSAPEPPSAPTAGTDIYATSTGFDAGPELGVSPEAALPAEAVEHVLEEVEETSIQFFDDMDSPPQAEQEVPEPPQALPKDEILDPLDALLPDDVVRRALDEE